MADVALRPTFPDAELERLRQERLTELLQARDDAASVAPMAFARLLFGPSHRYGTGAIGTPATLKAFTTSDLKAFHAAAFQPANSALIVVGDVTADGVVPQLEKQFGSWRVGSAPPSRTQVPAAPQPTQRQIVIVDMPGAEQSQIRIGGIGVPRSTPDYFPLQVLNTILGGSFTSRLNQNLREQHGYSYGAGSRFDMRLFAGPFFAAAGVQTDKTSEALREFFNELNAIRKPVGADELAKATNYLAFGFPSQFETIGDFSAQLEQLLVYGLPETYLHGLHQEPAGCHRRGRAQSDNDLHPARAIPRSRRWGPHSHRTRHSCPESWNGPHDVYSGGVRRMSIALELAALMAYSDQERGKWRTWIEADPTRLTIPFQRGGRFPTVGNVLDHVFLIERRHLTRMQGGELPDKTGVPRGRLARPPGLCRCGSRRPSRISRRVERADRRSVDDLHRRERHVYDDAPQARLAHPAA